MPLIATSADRDGSSPPLARRLVTAVTLTLALLMIFLPTTNAAEPFGPAGTWKKTHLPTPLGGLLGVDVAGDSTIAVGFRIEHGQRFVPMASSWNGRRWKSERVPTGLRQAESQLRNVDLLSPTRGWAVGKAVVEQGARAIVAIWNGKRWKSQPTDNLTGDVGLLGVAAVSETDVWAAGQEQIDFQLYPLLAHYDGNDWSEAAVPPLDDVGENSSLTSVSAASADAVWAVGFGGVSLYYDGTNWRQVAVPTFDGAYAELQEVRTFGPGDTWAVGYYSVREGRQPVVLRWTGAGWEQMALPAGPDARLEDVARVDQGRTVAVGYSEVEDDSAFYGIEFEADGSSAPLELPKGRDALFGAAGDPVSGQLWVVGSTVIGTEGKTRPYAALRR